MQVVGNWLSAANSREFNPFPALNPRSTRPLEHGRVANLCPVIIAGVPCSCQRGHSAALDELKCSQWLFFPDE